MNMRTKDIESVYEERRVFHFSAGKSSAIMVLNNYREGDLVIFCDTGREDSKTYKFLNDFEAFEGIPVIRIEMEGGWQKMLKNMQGIPNRAKRQCTIQLKIKTARRYLRSLGWNRYTQFVGFRADEQIRIGDYKNFWKFVKTRFPLNEEGIETEDVTAFWLTKPYHLEIPQILGNCDLCFHKGEDKVIAILTNDPSKADKWIADEENKELNPNGHTYFKNKTMRQLRDFALGFIAKGKVFELEGLTSKFNCSCGA